MNTDRAWQRKYDAQTLQLDQLTRRHENCLDTLRALQYLVDAIHVTHQGQTPAEGTILADAYANACASIRTHHLPNGH